MRPASLEAASIFVFGEPVDQSAEHACDFFPLRLQGCVIGRLQQATRLRKFEERGAFLDGTTRDATEAPAIRLGEMAVTFGDVCGTR